MQTRIRRHGSTCLALCALWLAGAMGCDSCGPTSTRFTIGGTVAGLTGSSLVLTTPGQADLTLVAGQTSFAFAAKVDDGTPYDVKVGLQPTAGTCSVAQGSGVVHGGDVSVAVTCSGTSAWTETGSMVMPRAGYPVAETLASGRVLVAGGHTSTTRSGWLSEIIANAEVFDLDAGLWTETGAMAVARRGACSIRLPSGDVLAVGGQHEETAGVVVTENTAELYDPASGTWTRTAGDLNVARAWATCTLLDSGKVLVVGGMDDFDTWNITATAELYDPGSGTFTLTGSMATARWFHTTTKLASGKALVVGGCSDQACIATASTELYDPDTGLWSGAGELSVGVASHTATLLANGAAVLVAGGCHSGTCSSTSGYEMGASLYDPGAGLWTITGSLGTGRAGHAAMLLDSGDVLVAGGVGETDRSTERYHPASGTWEPGPSTFAPHGTGAVARLPDGRWLVAGGWNTDTEVHFEVYPTAEIFEEGDLTEFTIGGTVTGLTGSNLVLTTPGEADLTLVAGQTSFAFAARVGNGTPYDVRVGLQPTAGTCSVARGSGTVDGGDVSVAVTCSGTSAWTETGSLNLARGYYPVTETLASGNVLLAGGHSFATQPGWVSAIVPNAELFDPDAGHWTETGTMTVPRRTACSARLPSGVILVVGGQNDAPNGDVVYLKSAELYDPASGTWTRTAGDLNVARSYASCTLLDSGKVLVAGGLTSALTGNISSAEQYDPESGMFSPTGSMAVGHWNHTATRLISGEVLVVGGGCTFSTCDATASAELYHPDTGLWSGAGAVPVGVLGHTATLLLNGKVLVAGGCHRDADCRAGDNGSGRGKDAEKGASLYDPDTGLWSDAGSMQTGRVGHAAFLLGSGDVLVVGGGFRPGTAKTTEIYHPASDTWQPGPSTFVQHDYAGVAQLLDKRCLVAGGVVTNGVGLPFGFVGTTELFEE